MVSKSDSTTEVAERENPASAVVADRRNRDDRRRREEDRRKRAIPVAVDRRVSERRGERRRQIDPTTCERDYNEEELAFMAAMDEYKREFCRPFPTWSEVLEVFKAMGYRKVAEKSTILQNRGKGQPPEDEEFEGEIE